MTDQLPVWKDEYNTGIPEVDHQHRYFIEMIHTLKRRVDAGMDRNSIAAYLKEIIYYTNFHFLSESNLMKYHGFDGEREHMKFHDEITTQLMYRYNQFEVNSMDCDDFLVFLADWFIHHTVEEDMKFGRYIREKHISVS